MSRPKKDQPQKTNSPLKKLRLSVKLSQEKLAREINVAVSSIRRWEKGDCEPTMTLDQVRKFCQVTKVDFYSLPNSLIER